MNGLSVRPREARDDAWIVTCHNADEGDSLPLSLETYRAEVAPEAGRVPAAALRAEDRPPDGPRPARGSAPRRSAAVQVSDGCRPWAMHFGAYPARAPGWDLRIAAGSWARELIPSFR